MKKIRKVLLTLLLLIIFFEIVINLIIFAYKNNLQKNLLKNAEIKNIYYIFPNILFIKDIEFTAPSFAVNIKNSFFYLNIFKIFKKDFIIHSIKAKNIYLEFLSTDTGSFKDLDINLVRQSLLEFVSSLPLRVSVKDVSIKYKDQVILINRIIKTTIEKDRKSMFLISGEWNRYLFNFNVDLFNNNSWLIKGKVFLPNFGLGINNANIEIFGDFDLNKVKCYTLWLNKDDRSYLVMRGEINPLSLEITGDIDTKFGKAKMTTIRDEDGFKINFNGLFDFKLPKIITDRVNLQNIGTDFYLVFSSSGYKVDSKISLKEFLIDLNIENSKGSGYVFLNSSKQKIPFNVIYKDKSMRIYNNLSKQPLDLNINFSKEKEFLASGKVLNYLVYFKINRDLEFLESNLNIATNNYNFKLDYVTDFSSASIKFTYDDKKDYHISFDSTLKDDRINFNLLSKKFKISSLSDIRFSAKGEIRNIKKDKVYNLNVNLNNLYYKQNKILKNLYILGKYDHNDITLTFEDKTLFGNFSYNILKNHGSLFLNIDNRQLQIDKLKGDLLCTLKAELKQNTLNLEGNYRIKSLFYNNEEVINLSKGEISSSLDNIVLRGDIITKNNNINYNVSYDYKSKQITLKTKNVNLLPDIKKIDLFNIELTSKIDDSEPLRNLKLSGKLYNESSEVIISSFNLSLVNDTISAYLIAKNLKIKNFNFIGNVDLFVRDFSKKFKNFKLYFENLWINEQYVDKLYLNFTYNTTSKELVFLHDDSKPSNLRFAGKIYFLKKIMKFLDFKVFDKTNEYFVCNGTVGENNEILRISISGISLNLIKNWFRLPLYNVDGLFFSNIKVLTIDSNKSIYQIYSDFFVNKADIETVKFKNISGKLSFYHNNLNFENVEFVFKENKKITIRGFYNFANKNLDLRLTSHNCELSVFNGFKNLVKSASGKFVLNLRVTGNISAPNLSGYLNINKGKIEFDEYLRYIDNLNVNLLFNEKNIKIDKFYGSYENTTFSVGGRINLIEGYSLRLKTSGGNGIFVRIPELSFPVGQFFKIIRGEKFFPSNGNVHFDITIVKRKNQPPMATGDIILNNTHFTYPGVSSKGKTPSLGFYHNLNLIANNNVWYENEYLSTNISGKINFYFNEGMQKMNINGEATALRGKVNFLNNNFNLTMGKLEIIDRTVYIQLTGETEITTPEREKIPINLIIERSRIEDVKPKLISPTYPELKTEEITSLLLGVGRIQRLGGKVSIVSTEKIDYLPLLRTQFIRMIDTTFATPIAKNILKRWGIADNFSIVSVETHSNISDSEQKIDEPYNKFKVSDIFKDTKYVIEKYVTSDMLVSYSIAFAEIQNKLNLKHEVEISYRLKNNIFIKGLYDYSIRDYTNQYTPNVSIMIQPTFRFKTWAEEEKE